tara:strand:- start:316 stop:537 length:222 start_codon:yes stop_codon:yes gene_type:complete
MEFSGPCIAATNETSDDFRDFSSVFFSGSLPKIAKVKIPNPQQIKKLEHKSMINPQITLRIGIDANLILDKSE